ncbi:MAG: helix-turn-helix domain-containing protein [Ignavibacteriales bacterium]|nr:helix-turn-helix domain-containing protein [Ignavibacteriales bacterium]
MNAFSTELRKERESRNITLVEIAKRTRINIKYLEAIEQGAFDVLPQTYVRAFLKSYADNVGIPATEVLYKYDVMVTRKYSDSPEHAPTDYARQVEASPETQEKIKKEKTARHAIMITGFVAVVALFGLYLYDSYTATQSSQKVPETSFQDVVKDQETKNQPAPVDSAALAKIALSKIPEPDSLVLRLIASDSVWLTIIRDSLPPRTGYLLRGRYRTYIAKKEFRISLSDASMIKLILNGIELPPLGEKGERIRNAKINSDLLKP